MPDDIFDKAAAQKPKGDIFDQASSTPKQSIQVPDPIAQARQQVAKPIIDEYNWQKYIKYGQAPGAAEGAGLREGLGEYVGSVGSKMGGGAKDIAQGNYSRGASKLIRGTGEAMIPALPFVAAGAPAATVTSLIGGTAGSALAGKGAQLAGATPDQQQLASDVGGIIGGGAGAKVPGMLPSAARSGATMNAIVGANKDVAVPVFDASSEAMRAKEIFQAGGTSFPAPMRKFLIRVMDPDRPPVTLAEARDFYTNATKQTAKEWSEMNGPMKKQMALFTKALGENVESALNDASPGQGTALRQAMTEYGNAKSLVNLGSKALKLGAGAAGAGAVDAWIRSLIHR